MNVNGNAAAELLYLGITNQTRTIAITLHTIADTKEALVTTATKDMTELKTNVIDNSKYVFFNTLLVASIDSVGRRTTTAGDSFI